MSSTGIDPTESVNGEDDGDPLSETVEAPRLVIAFDCQRPMAGGMRASLLGFDEVMVGRGSQRAVARTDRTARVFLEDVEASRHHVRLRQTVAGWELFDLGSKNGTVVNGARVANAILADGDLVEIGGTFMVFREEPADASHLGDRDVVPGPDAAAALLTLNNDLESIYADVTKLAPASVSMLIRGETGTGKEILARAVHARSGRTGAFVPVNCGALPRALLESELFGYRRGAFSGAKDDRDGLIQKAHRGTLFLDEVGELPLDSQAALLRVLQGGEVRPVGGNEHVSVDVRFLAATHQDLSRLIVDGRFRQDLYARLAGFVAVQRPLRHRREDIGVIIASLLPRLTSEVNGVVFRPSAARALLRYDYPLNIRELEQALHSATVLAGADEIRLRHLPEPIRNYVPMDAASQLPPADRMLRDTLLDAMRRNRGNVAAVGRAMGKAPMQIRRWCSRFGIDIAAFRG